MKYSQLLHIVDDEPLFETSLLVKEGGSPYRAQRRLVDWTKGGKVTRLRRGLYTLPKSHRQVEPHPFVVANRLVPNSYISLEMALRYYNLIPEYVAVITSVTTGRPGEWKNEFGRFLYNHIHPRYFFGMKQRLIVKGQYATIAYPEKALLDLIYLRKRGDAPEFIHSLRLQNLEQLNLTRLQAFTDRFGKPKIHRASALIQKLVKAELLEFEKL